MANYRSLFRACERQQGADPSTKRGRRQIYQRVLEVRKCMYGDGPGSKLKSLGERYVKHGSAALEPKAP